MTDYLLDTSVLTRWANGTHPDHAMTVATIQRLLGSGDRLFVAAQNIIEFWTVATRPSTERNGLGLTPGQAGRRVDVILRTFPRLEERDVVFAVWNTLVRRHGVSGRAAHDARLAAMIHVHGVRHILTFDATGFTRYPDVIPIRPDAATP